MTLSAADAFQLLEEFSRDELATGGPDPQVLLTARATDHRSDEAAADLVGCFIAPYTCGAAGPLWAARDALSPVWIAAHWDGLPRRRERRAIDKRTGEKLYACIASWRVWTRTELPRVRRATYGEVYASLRSSVQFVGRYAAMKAIETLYQRQLVRSPQDSICAVGATYPRKMLAWVYPAYADALTTPTDAPEVIAIADRLAAELRERLGIASWFAFETLLCNARQALAGKYPGRSHDRELAHFRRAEAYWGPRILEWFPFYALRARLFPNQYIGELGDPPWTGAREPLEVAQRNVYRQRGWIA